MHIDFFLSPLSCASSDPALELLGLYLNKVIDTAELLRTGFSWWVGNVVGILALHTAHIGLCAKNCFENFFQKIYGGGDFPSYSNRNLFTTAS